LSRIARVRVPRPAGVCGSICQPPAIRPVPCGTIPSAEKCGRRGEAGVSVPLNYGDFMNTASRSSRFTFHFTSSALLALLVTSPGCKDKPPVPTETSAAPVAATASTGVVPVEKTSFAAVTSKLDPGGSVFVYLNTAQWLDGLSGNLGAWRDDL